MSGLYNPNFSPVRAASPQIRTTPITAPDMDRYLVLKLFVTLLLQYYNCVLWFTWLILIVFCFELFSQYLSELLAEYQKLGPFIKVLPNSSRLLNQGLPLLLLSRSIFFFTIHIPRSPPFPPHFTSHSHYTLRPQITPSSIRDPLFCIMYLHTFHFPNINYAHSDFSFSLLLIQNLRLQVFELVLIDQVVQISLSLLFGLCTKLNEGEGNRRQKWPKSLRRC